MRGSRDEGCLSEGELEWQVADFFREVWGRELTRPDQARIPGHVTQMWFSVGTGLFRRP
jgi:hypothetical protein